MKKLLITVNGKRYEVEVEVLEDDSSQEIPQAYRPSAQLNMASYSSPAPKPKSAKSVRTGDKKTLTSPINGVVLEISAKEGQTVKENEVLMSVEAMKMKTNIASPQDGKVKTIHVKIKDTIAAGQVLLTFE